MTYKEESYLLNTVTENNIMLNQIVQVLNAYLANHNQENDNDFMRNILANVVSEVFTKPKKK